MVPLTLTASAPGVPLRVSGTMFASTAVMLAVVVLFAAGAFDDHAVFEPDLVARKQTEETFRRHLGEIVALDPDFGAECKLAGSEIAAAADGLAPGRLRSRRRRISIAS